MYLDLYFYNISMYLFLMLLAALFPTAVLLITKIFNKIIHRCMSNSLTPILNPKEY